MALRTVCLCDGKYIGIESIFTVINGNQINIPEKLEELRSKSRNNELFCPCGCSENLILVASDKSLREQHFRLKNSNNENKCKIVEEGKTSVNSKIVLKCWLDEKLNTKDLDTRVPISHIGDINRKYEFSFISKARQVAVSYCYDRANLSDERFNILEDNSKNIQLIYIVDIKNNENAGQYPEYLMKIQKRQGYCLFLETKDISYKDAEMYSVFYAQDNTGFWKKIQITEGKLSDYTISNDRQLQYKNKNLSTLLEKQRHKFEQSLQAKIKRNEKDKKLLAEKQQQEELEHITLIIDKQIEKAKKEWLKQHAEAKSIKETEEKENLAEIERRKEDFRKNKEEGFLQQVTQVIDEYNNRWIKCEVCNEIKVTTEFATYGGLNHVNLGICNKCSKEKSENVLTISTPNTTNDTFICPNCGGKLKKKDGRYGKFVGCSNYPKCKYSRKI